MLCSNCGEEIIVGREVNRAQGGFLVFGVGISGGGTSILCEKCAFPPLGKKILKNQWFRFIMIFLIIFLFLSLLAVFTSKISKIKDYHFWD